MNHDKAHEYRQNEALRQLARYVAGLRAALKDRYPVGDGNPLDDVNQILGPDEDSSGPELEAVLNRTVPTPEEVKAMFPPKAKTLPKKLSESGPSDG